MCDWLIRYFIVEESDNNMVFVLSHGIICIDYTVDVAAQNYLLKSKSYNSSPKR